MAKTRFGGRSLAGELAEISICREAKPRLAFVDGMRGLASLYVVLYHAAGDTPPPAAVLRFLGWFLQFGHYAVGIFIVLSGFCLMLPVARSSDGRIDGGWPGFFRRRARRLLPAYYTVLLLALVAVAIVRLWRPQASGEEADVLRLSPGTVISHLLLLHNLREQWAQAFDPPMWSIAAEWQIYFLFPLLLIPIWRRLGSAQMVLCGWFLGMAPHILLPASSNFDWTFPWYIGLFALGMAGAAVSFSPRHPEARWRVAAPWGTAAGVCALIFIGMAAASPDLPAGRMWLPDIVLGISAAAILVRCAIERDKTALAHRSNAVCPRAIRALESAPIRWIGAFSYSLYLLHAPILWLSSGLFGALHPGENIAFVLRLTVGVPVAVAGSYGFFLLVERRFLRSRFEPALPGACPPNHRVEPAQSRPFVLGQGSRRNR